MWAWARRRGSLPETAPNPWEGAPVPGRDLPRDRVLTGEEIGLVWVARQRPASDPAWAVAALPHADAGAARGSHGDDLERGGARPLHLDPACRPQQELQAACRAPGRAGPRRTPRASCGRGRRRTAGADPWLGGARFPPHRRHRAGRAGVPRMSWIGCSNTSGGPSAASRPSTSAASFWRSAATLSTCGPRTSSPAPVTARQRRTSRRWPPAPSELRVGQPGTGGSASGGGKTENPPGRLRGGVARGRRRGALTPKKDRLPRGSGKGCQEELRDVMRELVSLELPCRITARTWPEASRAEAGKRLVAFSGVRRIERVARFRAFKNAKQIIELGVIQK